MFKCTHVGGYASVAEVTNRLYTENNKDTSEKDDRRTLYWHPLLLLDAEHTTKINLEFFNNDFGNDYWVIIKGVTADGRLVDYRERIFINDPK